MSIDNRSQIFVFVPFCLMCQSFQAKGIVKYNWSSSITPVMNLLLEKDVNIIQMPCPESSFNGYQQGLSRLPSGLKKYSSEEYFLHCETLANNVFETITAIIQQGYQIKAILGIENSPTCAVNHIYSNHGTLKRHGVYIGILNDKIKEIGYDIPIIGLNRKNIAKSLLILEKSI